MFFHVHTRKGCDVLTNSSVKHSFKHNPRLGLIGSSIHLIPTHQLIIRTSTLCSSLGRFVATDSISSGFSYSDNVFQIRFLVCCHVFKVVLCDNIEKQQGSKRCTNDKSTSEQAISLREADYK